jgi:FlaA1/EpsC-like NDP-sugar epimerase
MGEPIRILDLAENMIRLAGKVPYEDIDIEFTGLRPGEKLIEELRGKSEGLMATSTEKMSVIREHPIAWDRIERWINGLQDLIASKDEQEIIAHIKRLVPEFNPEVSGTPQTIRMTCAEEAAKLRVAS